MTRTTSIAAALAIAAAALPLRPALAADAAHGADVFAQECADCHSMTPGKSKKGPSLSRVVGRKAGTMPEFANYSAALKDSGLTWTPDKITAYVRNPRQAVPGGTMKYDGLSDAASISDLIAFLSSAK